MTKFYIYDCNIQTVPRNGAMRYLPGMKVFLFNICIYSLALMLTNVSELLGVLDKARTKPHFPSFERLCYTRVIHHKHIILNKTRLAWC